MHYKRVEPDIERIAASLYRLEIIASEIVDFTKENERDVWKRMCLEIEQAGYNVCCNAREYDVTPHEFNENMIRLYKESDGFIYETLIESRNPHRVEKWLNIVRFLMSVSGEEFNSKKVLVYGDSVGSDSLFLREIGFDVYYYDFESYCSSFANYRFSKRGLKINKFPCNSETFDFVICLEVAEHVPEPKKLINELCSLTSEDGYCIFSEAFQLVNEKFPTHLKSNLEYVDRTDELFKEVGMNVFWRDYHDKPIIYTKNKKRRGRNLISSRLGKKIIQNFKPRLKKSLNW